MVKTLRDPLTLKDAAGLAGLSPVTLRIQIRNGKLKAAKAGRDWLVWRADLKAYLANRGKR